MIVLALLVCSAGAAQAGAWTQKRGHWQVITTTIYGDAPTAFDGKGNTGISLQFDKALLLNAAEYGLTNRITLLLNTETAYARSHLAPSPRVKGLDNAYEGGARFLLSSRHGMFSVQASYKSAGAFNFSVSANSRVAGSAAELRFLYGGNFKLAGRDGFFDLQAGQRFLSAPRANETPLDLTAGLWLTPSRMVMLQNFNVIGGGDGQPPYGYFRSHKLEVSVVQRLTKRLLVQAGVFYSPLGQNALRERGVVLALWTQV